MQSEPLHRMSERGTMNNDSTRDVTVSWRTRAACRGMDTNVFFPTDTRHAKTAQAICATCAVISECREFAIRHGCDHGVWGGLTERDRARLHARRRSCS